MNKPNRHNKFDFNKNTPKKKFNNLYEEEQVSFREIKRDRNQKHFRNYDNALRSKNLDRLLSYDEDYDG